MRMFVASIASLLLFSTAFAADEVINLGGETIRIPIPEGYVKADGEKKVAEIIERISSGVTSNIHLLTLLTPTDLEAAKSGRWSGRISLYVQALRANQKKDVVCRFSDFEKIKQQLKGASAANMRSAIDKATKGNPDADLKEVFDSMKANLGKPVILNESDRHITMAIPFAADNTIISSSVLCSGKIVYLYAAENPTNPAVDTQHMKNWVAQVVSANPAESKLATNAPATNFVDSILNGAIIGGVIGGLVGVVTWLAKRKQKANEAA